MRSERARVTIEATNATSIVDSWSQQPLWQVLGAVRNKQVAEVDGDSWARNRGVLASEQIAEDALAILKGGKAVLSQ